MVDKNLSVDITEATTIAATDLLYAVIGGNSRRIKLSNVFTSPVLVTPALGTPSSGVLTNVTGTASGLTAGNVTTNANLTGPITSVGNATSITSQTGTGTKFVVDTTPTLVTPVLGVASGTSLALGGATIGTNALAVTGAVTISANLTNAGIANFAGNSLNISNSTGFISTFNAGYYGFTSSNSANGTVDTTLSRNSAGVQQFGTNAANAAGSWLATNGTLSGTLSAGNTTITGAFYAASAVTIALSNGITISTNVGAYAWSSGAGVGLGTDTFDTNISRSSAGVLQLGTTARNALGSLLLTTLTATGTVSTTSTTDATTTTSGSIQTLGGMAVRKRVFMDGLTASAGLQTAVICQSSAGELIADSVACLASSVRFKELLGSAENGALDKIIRVPVQRWKYRREEGSVFPDNYYSEHIGPTAEDIEAIDSRLVGRDNEGRARSISTDQLLALAIQAIQEQQVQIEELRARAA